jgi:chaperonin cofactor prefoldin
MIMEVFMNKKSNTMINKFLFIFIVMFFCTILTTGAQEEQALVTASMVKEIARETAREVLKEQNSECGLRCIIDRSMKAICSFSLPYILGISAGGSAAVIGLALWKKYGATPVDLRNAMGHVGDHAGRELDNAREVIGRRISASTQAAQDVHSTLDGFGVRIDEFNGTLQDQHRARQDGFTRASTSFIAMARRLGRDFDLFGRNTSGLLIGARISYAALLGAQSTRMQDLYLLSGQHHSQLRTQVEQGIDDFNKRIGVLRDQANTAHSATTDRIGALAGTLEHIRDMPILELSRLEEQLHILANQPDDKRPQEAIDLLRTRIAEINLQMDGTERRAARLTQTLYQTQSALNGARGNLASIAQGMGMGYMSRQRPQILN